nr:hypothetical protein [Tanacetum cinerariifolium]
MHGSEYGEQDRKAKILYEYETFKAIEGEQFLDTYLYYLQVINDLKKCGYKKDNLNTFGEKINEFNEQIKVLNEKNADLLDQTKVLKDQLQVKHVMIDTHVECHEKYAKLEAESVKYMIRYSALFDNDKEHRKQIADQEVLFDKMSVELVELDKHVRDL